MNQKGVRKSYLMHLTTKIWLNFANYYTKKALGLFFVKIYPSQNMDH